MLKNPPVQAGQPAAFNGQAIFNPDTIKLCIKKLNFIFLHFHFILKKFLYNIISHIHVVIEYPIIDFFI